MRASICMLTFFLPFFTSKTSTSSSLSSWLSLPPTLSSGDRVTCLSSFLFGGLGERSSSMLSKLRFLPALLESLLELSSSLSLLLSPPRSLSAMSEANRERGWDDG